MSKTRFIALGSIGIVVIAGAAVLTPSSRHFIRHQIAQHRHFRFSTTTATDVVPVKTELPAVASVETDPLFNPRPSAEVASGPTAAPTLDASGFAPPTPTTVIKHVAVQESPPLDDGPVATPRTAEQDATADVDLAGAKQALRLYRSGDLVAADEFARLTSGPLRTLLDWSAIRLASRQAGIDRLQAFLAAHPDWPARSWLRRRLEEQMSSTPDPAKVLAQFATAEPETPLGKMALARARIASGDAEGGAKIVRTLWRDEDLTPGEETLLLRDFSGSLRREDHKYRADRLLYKESVLPALRIAALAGPDVLLLAKARVAVISSAPSDAAIAAVPKPLQSDPGLLFSRIQKARRSGKIADAAAMLLTAPSDPDALVNGDEWWVERRLVARKLLDAGDAKTAYRICAGEAASTNAMQIEGEFHAGWIALRFLKDPALAAPHFALASKLAETPISISRGAYWQGRTAEAAGDTASAAKFFTVAAEQPTTFYGQLAGAEIGRPGVTLRPPVQAATGDSRREATRVVALLFALGERDLGASLAFAMAKTEPDEAQVAALAQVVAAAQDARATLVIGKLAAQRGMALDDAAFPTFGIPGFQPLANSADRSTVYAIARQESEFDPRSVSSAGAKGLMQLIASTARQTAEHAGVGFDEQRLLSDAAFNAQIGAAHLGKLLADEGGSYILTFAAYNAGSRKVQDWIQAYGDPRKPGVDPIDWIERIPFTETRNYVQRVFENLQIYRSRFGMPTAYLVAEQKQAGKGT